MCVLHHSLVYIEVYGARLPIAVTQGSSWRGCAGFDRGYVGRQFRFWVQVLKIRRFQGFRMGIVHGVPGYYCN